MLGLLAILGFFGLIIVWGLTNMPLPNSIPVRKPSWRRLRAGKRALERAQKEEGKRKKEFFDTVRSLMVPYGGVDPKLESAIMAAPRHKSLRILRNDSDSVKELMSILTEDAWGNVLWGGEKIATLIFGEGIVVGYQESGDPAAFDPEFRRGRVLRKASYNPARPFAIDGGYCGYDDGCAGGGGSYLVVYVP